MKTPIEKLITDIAKKGYVVSFDVHKDKVQISVQPVQTGMGSTNMIHIDANWCDALKAIEMKLFY